MLQLRNSDYFRFNGIDSESMNWMVCNVSGNTEFNLGVQRSVNKEATNNGSLFKGVKDGVPRPPRLPAPSWAKLP